MCCSCVGICINVFGTAVVGTAVCGTDVSGTDVLGTGVFSNVMCCANMISANMTHVVTQATHCSQHQIYPEHL